MFATITQVKIAVEAGHKVCWKTDDYVVGVDLFGQWHITYRPWSLNPNTVGLFWADGVTSDYSPEDFYSPEEATA